MNTFLTCKTCGETDDKHALTGARIDGQYYCQACYDKKLNAIENEIISRQTAKAGKGE